MSCRAADKSVGAQNLDVDVERPPGRRRPTRTATLCSAESGSRGSRAPANAGAVGRAAGGTFGSGRWLTIRCHLSLDAPTVRECASASREWTPASQAHEGRAWGVSVAA